MWSAVAIALAFQAAPAADFLAQVDKFAQASFSAAFCLEMGYDVDMGVLEGQAQHFSKEVPAGVNEQEIRSIFSQAVEEGEASLGLDADLSELTDVQRGHHVVNAMNAIKVRCRQVADDFPGSIIDVDAGDQKIDADLAHILSGGTR